MKLIKFIDEDNIQMILSQINFQSNLQLGLDSGIMVINFHNHTKETML